MTFIEENKAICLIKDVAKEYKTLNSKQENGAFVIKRGFNLEIRKNEVISLWGPNGAGKTTLIKMMCGLILPTEGQIIINNINVHSQTREALSSVGVLFEGNRNFNWRLTPEENLIYYGYLRGLPSKFLKERIKFLLNSVGLWEKRNVLSRCLSRGMQQKLSIAISLLHDPDLLILDEPFSSLDSASVQEIKGIIFSPVLHNNKTVIIATKDIETIKDITNRLAVLIDGELIFCSDMKDLPLKNDSDKCVIYLREELTMAQIHKLLNASNVEIKINYGRQIIFNASSLSVFADIIELLRNEGCEVDKIQKGCVDLNISCSKVIGSGTR